MRAVGQMFPFVPMTCPTPELNTSRLPDTLMEPSPLPHLPQEYLQCRSIASGPPWDSGC